MKVDYRYLVTILCQISKISKFFQTFKKILAILPLTSVSPLLAAEPLPIIELTIADKTITAELAASPDSRSVGLMGRSYLPENHGMVLDFQISRPVALWMRNTKLPLSAAFIDEYGKILEIINLEPLNESIRRSTKPVRYALEMEQGWYLNNEITIGTRVNGLPSIDPLKHENVNSSMTQ